MVFSFLSKKKREKEKKKTIGTFIFER